MPKFEIRVSERSADWREAPDRDAAMQSASDAMSGAAPLQSVVRSEPVAINEREPQAPSALQSVAGIPSALQSVVGT